MTGEKATTMGTLHSMKGAEELELEESHSTSVVDDDNEEGFAEWPKFSFCKFEEDDEEEEEEENLLLFWNWSLRSWSI